MFHKFVGGIKKKNWRIVLWGCLTFARFKKADDIGTAPHSWYSTILVACIEEGCQP